MRDDVGIEIKQLLLKSEKQLRKKKLKNYRKTTTKKPPNKQKTYISSIR